MMTATQQFFDIPELIQLMAIQLDNIDIARISCTNRRLHQWTRHLVFRTLNLDTNPRNSKLLLSSNAKQAMAKNIGHTCALKASLLEFTYLITCWKTYQDALPSDDTTRVVCPYWLPASDSTNILIIPLSPPYMLVELKLNLNFHEDDTSCPYFLYSSQVPTINLLRLCWILQMCPHLHKLSVDGVTIKSRADFRFLVTNVSGLLVLRDIDMRVYVPYTDMFTNEIQEWSIFLLSCPASIRSFQVDFKLGYCFLDYHDGVYVDIDDEYLNIEGDQALRSIIHNRNLNPFAHLTTLAVPLLFEYLTVPISIQQVLSYCPNVYCLTITQVGHLDYLLPFATVVKNTLPQLRELICIDHSMLLATVLTMLTEGLLENQLKTLILERLWYRKQNQDCERMKGAFQRHSISLHTIEFTDCRYLCDGWFGLILKECQSLGVLKFASRPNERIAHVHLLELTDAVPWRCTQLHHLEIPIGGIAVPPYPSSFASDGHDPIIAAVSDNYEKLKCLYQQLGALTKLTYLNIHALSLDSKSNRVKSSWNRRRPMFFPRLTTLSAANGGIDPYGCLSLLGGLNKLRVLRGSILVKVLEDEGQMTMGWAEVRWIANYWPSLQVAEFFEAGEELTEPFEWLRKQHKDGQLVLHKSLCSLVGKT